MTAPLPPPLVSFCVPAYNHARYIRRCLDSIAQEPYEPKELVLIDDGSSDETREVIERWIAENGMRLTIDFTQQRNAGISATLNRLVTRAKGKYVRICASDDFATPGTLGDLVAALETHPDKRFAIGDALIVDENDHTVMRSAIFEFRHGRKKNYFSDAGLRREIVCNWSLPGCVQLVRRDLYDDIGHYDEQLMVEDWDFMLRVVARNYLIYVDKIVAAYRVHSSNSFTVMTKKDPLKSARESLRVLEKHHLLFDGALGRDLDYRLLKEREVVKYLSLGRRQGRWSKIQSRLRARISTYFRRTA